MDRKDFIKSALSLSALGLIEMSPLSLLAADGSNFKLTILHTNDTHSRIDPFPNDGSKYANRGGVKRRSALIKKIRAEEKHVLLLDAGDIFQGTPYFNFFKGEVEMKAMKEMGYDACTIGNHDFDLGAANLAEQLKHTNFPMLIANYDFSSNSLVDKTERYRVFEFGKLKVGVFGLGIELNGLVLPEMHEGTCYMDPIEVANKVSYKLKEELECTYVICLSHLGFKYGSNKISDFVLAQNTAQIDLIIGGHTHTFLEKPAIVLNKIGKEVLINQVGFGGLELGRIDVYFQKDLKKNFSKSLREVV